MSRNADQLNASENVDRREFLQASTGTLMGVLAAGTPIALLAPSRAWAVDFKSLSSAEGRTLLVMARTIAPHDKLEDAAYAVVIAALDADAAADPNVLTATRAGIASLGAGFATAQEPARVALLKKIEQGAFFQNVRTKTLQTLYATPMAYAAFGYEGEAFSKGGYLTRGFNNLRWLPDVPDDAGGPLPGGK
jgi:hypothetical protein